MENVTHTRKLNIARIRDDFPILKREVHPGVPLVYFDSAATSQKPIQVIEAMDNYYRMTNANIHRGIHALAEAATKLMRKRGSELLSLLMRQNRAR